MCNDKTIKELLPVYHDQALDQTKNVMIENHLASCEDCRSELSLLRLMAEETVYDPGQAFWATMPDRVFQSVQMRQTTNNIFDRTRFLHWMDIPRWTWAAATMAAVLIASWFIITPLQNKTEMPLLPGDEFADETVATGSVSIADLDNDELSTIDSWAGSELASIAQENGPALVNGRDFDLYEEIDNMNTREVERISNLLSQIRREG